MFKLTRALLRSGPLALRVLKCITLSGLHFHVGRLQVLPWQYCIFEQLSRLSTQPAPSVSKAIGKILTSLIASQISGSEMRSGAEADSDQIVGAGLEPRLMRSTFSMCVELQD